MRRAISPTPKLNPLPAPTLTQRILTALEDGRERRVAQIAREITDADPSIDFGAVMQSVRNLCQEQAGASRGAPA